MSKIHFDGRLIDLDRIEGPIPSDAIASTLARICRYNGTLRRDDWPVQWHSVADHSVLVSALLGEFGHGPDVALAGLFHDAHEALVGDIITPVKRWLGVADREKDLEMRLLDHLGLRRELTPYDMATIKEVDKLALEIEVNALGLPEHLFGVRRLPDASLSVVQSLCREIGVLQDVRSVPIAEVFTQSRERFLAMESKLLHQTQPSVRLA